MNLNNITIAKRLALVLGLILGLSLLSSLFAVAKLRQLSSEINAMIGDNVKVERATADWLRQTTSGA